MAITVPQNQVALQPLPQNRLQPADFGGEEIGQAVARGGQMLSRAVEVQEDINDRYNIAAVKNTEALAQAEVAELRRRVQAAVGLEAADARANALGELEQIGQKYSSALANPQQKYLFKQVYQRTAMAEQSLYADHEDKQIRVAEVEGAKSRLTVSRDRAIDLQIAGRTEDAREALADARLEMRTIGRGMPDNVLAQQDAALTTEFHAGVVEAMRAVPNADPLEIEAYLDSNAGEIAPGVETKLRMALKPEREEAEIDSAFGELLGMTEGVVPEVDEETAVAEGEAVARRSDDVLRGKGTRTSGFTSARDGGRRQHNARDYAAPAGTPVHPPMGGKVEKVWYDKAAGNSVLIRHPDGRVTSYAHLRNVNVQPGDDVDHNTVIGGVGNTGTASRGNHLHFTVRNAEGNRIDPDKQTWTGGPLARHEADRLDKQSLYDRARTVATKRGYTPRQYEDLLKRVDQHVSRADNLQARAEQDIEDRAWEQIAELGDGFTSMSQINLPADAPPRLRIQLQNMARQNAQPPQIEAGGDTFYELLEASGNPQQQDDFANMNLEPLRHSMSRGEFNTLKRSQINIRNGGGAESKIAVSYSRVNTMIRQIAPQAGIKTAGKSAQNKRNVERVTLLTTQARQRVEQRQAELGRQLTDAELYDIGRNLVTTVYQDDKPVPLYARDRANPNTQVRVPQSARDEILAAYRARGLPAPDERRIADLYLRGGGDAQ